MFGEELQHGDELAEDEDAVAAFADFFEEFVEEAELGGGLGDGVAGFAGIVGVGSRGGVVV